MLIRRVRLEAVSMDPVEVNTNNSKTARLTFSNASFLDFQRVDRFDCKGHEILLTGSVLKEVFILAARYEQAMLLSKSNTYDRAATSIADNVRFSSLVVRQQKNFRHWDTKLTSRRPLQASSAKNSVATASGSDTRDAF